ncbi:MAG: glucokinase [Minicystis sp.]
MSDGIQQTTVLVGDVGGTRTRLALYERGAKAPLAETVVKSGEHPGLEAIVQAFLDGAAAPHPYAAVFGVAGPVRLGAASITNLPWSMEERALERRLRIPRVGLANDLVVGARGCLEVGPDEMDLLTDTPPVRRGEHLGVIAAGTGLGEARLVWIGGRYHPLPTEGGHCDFAPRSQLEVELWQFLAARHPDHVSWERVVSGAGLGAIYDFFVEHEGPDPADVAARLAQGDRNAVICELGLSRAHRPAALAVDLFARIYGAEASNVALRELALGGIYVIGNIGSIILPARREMFREGFLQKGRFRDLLANIPVAVVRDPLVGLRGARALAEELALT